jgi:hypothetical protein
MAMSAVVGQIAERRIPLWRRPSLQFALAMALFGVALAAYSWFGILRMQDRRPAQPIAAPEIGRTFEVPDVFGASAARITVTSGQRQNQRGAGGDRADRDNVTLFLTYEAIGAFDPDSLAWHIDSTGMDSSSGYASLYLTPGLRLSPGETATGTVSFYGVVAGLPATITYQGPFDKHAVFAIVVGP